jgi:hypothetical protein
LCNSAVP